MKKTTLVILMAALVCGALAGIILLNPPGEGNRPRPEVATVGDLIAIQKHPPPDYIEELTLIIESNQNRTVRDAAVNTLTDIAIRKSETEKVMDFLKDLAAHEEDPVIMSAAYSSINLIRYTYPPEPIGSLDLSVSGNVRKGGTITIIATFASKRDVDRAVLGLAVPPDDIEMITPPVFYTNLTAHTGTSRTFQLRLLDTGEFKIPVQLSLSTGLTDSEQIDRYVSLVVREKDGEYTIG